MKREELKELGLEDAAIDSVMKLHGKSVEANNAKVETQKAKTKTAEDATQALQGQLDEATETIDGFKALKPDEIQASADEWKAKATQYQADAKQSAKDAEKSIADVEYNYALDDVLKAEFGVIDPSDVKGKLDHKTIVRKEGKFTGLAEQVDPMKKTHARYFSLDDEGKVIPKFSVKSEKHSVVSDASVDALRKGAGLKPAKE